MSSTAKKLFLAAGLAVYFGIFYLFIKECLFVRFLGIPCPGCGMTRAVLAALRLDFASAFSFHPMFWSLPYIFLYIFFDDTKLFSNKRLHNIILSVIGAGFVINWLFKLYHHYM